MINTGPEGLLSYSNEKNLNSLFKQVVAPSSKRRIHMRNDFLGSQYLQEEHKLGGLNHSRSTVAGNEGFMMN